MFFTIWREGWWDFCKPCRSGGRPASGGWAAKRLAEAGKTILMVTHDPRAAEAEARKSAGLEVSTADPLNLASHEREYQGQSYTAPHFAWQSHRVWGATCLILGELVTILEEAGGE